jgi:UDP-glucose 4-epimerase
VNVVDATTRRDRTVLVTGAAGFIGSALCRRLMSSGYRVVGYDDLSRGRREYLAPGVVLVEGDIRDRARLHETLSTTKPESVFHLAAMHFIPDCLARPDETLDVNVGGTRRVLEACRSCSVRQVVFASTAAVYAPTEDACREDTTSLGPVEVYGQSKLAAEELMRAFHEDTGTPTTILRLFNAVGRCETNPHVIPHIFESLQRSAVVALGNIAPRRDYIDTRDMADAMLAVLEAPGGLQVFNVGTGVAHSVGAIVESLGRILGRPIVVVQEPSRTRSTERMLLVADIEKIRRITHWTPRIILEEVLQDLVLAYGLHTQPHLAD